jgi:hypothetical protein
VSHPKDIKPRDSEYLRHGHWIEHHASRNIRHKGTYYHGEPYGYHIWYNENVNTSICRYEVGIMMRLPNDNPEGICIIWNKRELHK